MRYTFFLILSFWFVNVVGQSTEFYLFVGTYTKPRGSGEGIYVYKFNTTTGTASFISKIETENPSYVTISNNQQFVYAVNQNGNTKPNEASAFSFNKNTGNLTFINKQPVSGEGPCYITVDKTNKWIFTANYTAGSISAISVNKDGSLNKLEQLIQNSGSSIVKDRQNVPHAHTVVFAPKERMLVSTDLGTDRINIFSFSKKSTSLPLLIDSTSSIVSKPGNGPRHVAFSKKHLYVINELAGTIDIFKYKKNKNTLLQTISTDTSSNLDKGSADIHVTNDGKFLYATNRGKYNTIATYKINKNGSLEFLAIKSTEGKVPRNFVIDPTDNFVLIANQNSDNIVIFKRDKQTGLLTDTGNKIKVGMPVCLQMIPIN